MRNFRSYEDVEISFNSSGCTLLRGFNLDTGGSSYSGKSSVGVAIALALGFCPFSIKEQKTWGKKGPMSVSLELVFDDGVWTITRGDKTTLKPPEGEAITGVEAVDAKLLQLIGVGPKVLEAQTYRRQKSEGVFLHKTDQEKKDFLCTVTPLSTIEASVETAENNLKLLDAELTKLAYAVSMSKQEVASLPEIGAIEVDCLPLFIRKEELEAKLAEAVHEESSIEKVLNAMEDSLAAVKADVKAEFAQRVKDAQMLEQDKRMHLNTYQPNMTSDLMGQLRNDLIEARGRLSKKEADFIAKKKDLSTEILTLNMGIAALSRIESALEAKGRECVALKANLCYACGQALTDTHLKAKAAWEEYKVIEADIANIKEGSAMKESLEAELQALIFITTPKIERYREIVTQLEGDIRVHDAHLKQKVVAERAELQKELDAQVFARTSLALEEMGEAGIRSHDIEASIISERGALAVLRRQQKEIQGDLNLVQLNLKSTQLENEARARDSRTRLIQRAAAVKKLTEAQTQWDETMAKTNAEKDFIELVGYKGFLGAVFEEILGEITEETNTILASVANTAHVTIAFNSEAISAKGVTRKEIRPVTTINGYPASLASGASGGMGTAIDLAVDLAVANVVSRRTNSWPGWLILDESFEGLDQVSKETVMEMLGKHAANRLILVVDHASETKELFSNYIDIEFQNGVSRLRAQS